MLEPSNQELLTHILYIKERVDEHTTDVRTMLTTQGDHETRITVLEERTPAQSGRVGVGGIVRAAGAFIGGVVSGWLGGKAGG
jgi:hypothetical protein